MEITQEAVFKFNFVPEPGDNFNFQITAPTLDAACEMLHRKLDKVVKELAATINNARGKAAN